jgi:hypothetical protein
MDSQRYSRIQGDEKEDAPELPVDSITIQIPSRRPFEVSFFPGQTVGELKYSIQNFLSKTESPLPASRQRLAFNGVVLMDDNVTLHHLGLGADCRVHCFPRPPTTTTSVPMAYEARPSSDTPIVVGIVQSTNPINNASDDPTRRAELRRRGVAYHNLMQWSFRVRLFSLMCLFFYGFGLISNFAYATGDKDVPDDREMVPGEAPTEMAGPIFFLDVISNLMGILAAMLGLKSVRHNSFPIAQKYLRAIVALVLFSAIQLIMEVYAFSDRNHKQWNPTTTPSSSGSGSSPMSTKVDDVAFTVGLNLLVRGMFWCLLLNAAQKYVKSMVEVQVVNSTIEQVPDLESVAVAQPVVGVASSPSSV